MNTSLLTEVCNRMQFDCVLRMCKALSTNTVLGLLDHSTPLCVFCQRANYSSAPALNPKLSLWHRGNVFEEAVDQYRRKSEAGWSWSAYRGRGRSRPPWRRRCSFLWHPSGILKENLDITWNVRNRKTENEMMKDWGINWSAQYRPHVD